MRSSTQARKGMSRTKGLHNWFQYTRRFALALPAPERTWTIDDVPFDHTVANKLHRDGAIEHVGHRTREDPRTTVYEWETDPETYAWVQTHIDRPHETPCGNSGVHCIQAGRVFTCTDDECDCRFGPERARQVMR